MPDGSPVQVLFDVLAIRTLSSALSPKAGREIAQALKEFQDSNAGPFGPDLSPSIVPDVLDDAHTWAHIERYITVWRLIHFGDPAPDVGMSRFLAGVTISSLSANLPAAAREQIEAVVAEEITLTAAGLEF
jgi:hypothetical protein